MGDLTEKEIKEKFMDDIEIFSELVGLPTRIYSIEFPIRTEDGTKKADLVLEVDNEELNSNKKMMVLEFKRGFIDNGAASQVRRYSDNVGLQLYRKKKVTSFIVGSEFSDHEIKMCRELNVFPLQYDYKSSSMRLR